MTRRMKVYGAITAAARGDHELLGRRVSQVRVAVAAHSQAEAARALGVTLGHLRNYGGETFNPQELEAALARPGVPMIRALDDRGVYVARAAAS